MNFHTYYAVYREDGFVVRTGVGATGTPHALAPGESIWTSDEPIPKDIHFVEGEPVPYTPAQLAVRKDRPVGAISWDNQKMAWVLDYAELRASLKRLVHRVRDSAASGPIEFDGDTWDADLASRQAISDKLNELADTKEEYPELLIWRSAKNQNRTFGSSSAMAQWLRRLVGAMAKRDTLAKAKAWQRKAVLDSTADSDLPAFKAGL